MSAAPLESILTIDLDALAANHACLAAEAAGAEVAPVVKADGYGLGAAPVARRLWAEGARSFFVARLSEAERLRAALGDRQAKILVLDGAAQGSQSRLAAARLTPVLNTPEQADYWKAEGGGIPAGVHVDTGMNRLGLGPNEAEAVARSGLPISLVMSHLGNAAEPDDPRNARQLARFRTARALFPEARASLSASAGTFLGADYRFDQVRPGISLYGGGPRERPDPRIQAVATLDAQILQLRDLRRGEAVGYGAMFTAERAMRIAVLGAGYADGLLRAGHAGGAGWLDGRRVAILIVSMDLIAVDVSAVPRARVGDRVELLGPNARLDDLASAARSVAHELLVRISGRAERRYRGAVG